MLIVLVAIAAFACCAANGRSFTSPDNEFDSEKPFFHHHYFPAHFGRVFVGVHWPWFWGWPRWFGARHGHGAMAGNSGSSDGSSSTRVGRSQGGSQTGTGAIGSLENGGDNTVLGGGGDIGQP